MRWLARRRRCSTGLPDPSIFYHVHSYVPRPADEADVIGVSDYGGEFASVVGRGKVFGAQFHPEKSSTHGLALLRNFAATVRQGGDGRMILYPAIDILEGQAVRLVQGDFDDRTVYRDSPLEAARAWVDAGARFLHIVDLDGAKEGAPQNLEHVEAIATRAARPGPGRRRAAHARRRPRRAQRRRGARDPRHRRAARRGLPRRRARARTASA